MQELKSSVAGGKRFAHLTDYVNQKLREMGEEILDGNVAVDPLQAGEPDGVRLLSVPQCVGLI